MPLYEFHCPKCDCGTDRLQFKDEVVACPDCGTVMDRKFPSNIMVKMKGEGGYPSRRKQVFNTTYRKHPKLD